MIDRAPLFVQRLDDLICEVTNPDRWAPIRASAILRSLLVDGSRSLVALARRSRPGAPKPSFRVTTGQVPDASIGLVVDALDPKRSSGAVATISLDQFLATRVANLQGRSVSVKDLVLHAAYVLGGVHAGDPKSDVDQYLVKISAGLPALADPSDLLEALRCVGRLACAALQPVRDYILKLDRLEAAPAVTIALAIEPRRLSLKGDTCIVQFRSSVDDLRFFIREHQLKILLAHGEHELLAEGPFIRERRRVIVTYEVIPTKTAIVVRVGVDGVDRVRFLGPPDGLDLQSLVHAKSPAMQMGMSRYGVFAMYAWVVGTQAFAANQRLDLDAYLRYHASQTAEAVVFEPNTGLSTDEWKALDS